MRSLKLAQTSKVMDDKVDPVRDALNGAYDRLMGEVMNVLDILAPGDEVGMTISSTSSSGTLMRYAKSQKEAAKDVIRNAFGRVFDDLRNQLK